MEDSAVKQLILSGQQLQADVRLPLLYYDVVKSGLEPKQRNRSIKLQDIQYILKNDLKVISSILIFDMAIQILLQCRGSDPALSVLLMETETQRHRIDKYNCILFLFLFGFTGLG